MARIIFMGTPEYARRILSAVRRREDTFLVVTKPDMPVGRRRRLTPSPVALWAGAEGLPVLKPEGLKALREEFEAFGPDYILTAAFGRILRAWLLDLPRYGAYNLHASLLPRWRGPNPIAWAIRAGDAKTGATLMQMDAGVDTGPIVIQRAVPIASDDTTQMLTMKLADEGARLWLESLSLYGGDLPTNPQPSAGTLYAPKFAPDAGRLDWHQPASVLDAWVRSMTPDPGAYTMADEQRIKILAARATDDRGQGVPGTAVVRGNHWQVTTERGTLEVSAIQPAGRRPMSPGDFVRGFRGDRQWLLR